MHQTPPAVTSLIVLPVRKCTKMLRQWLGLIVYDMMSNYYMFFTCSNRTDTECPIWSLRVTRKWSD